MKERVNFTEQRYNSNRIPGLYVTFADSNVSLLQNYYLFLDKFNENICKLYMFLVGLD